MFTQWLLVICGFLMITDNPSERREAGTDEREISGAITYVQADLRGGWEITHIEQPDADLARK